MTLVEILQPSCALFLDFDGTMVDIAPQPHAVHVPEPLLTLLQDLDRYLQGAVAVISGRPIQQLDAFLDPLKLAMAGVHGAERRGADGRLHLLDTHPFDAVEEAACTLAAEHPGLLVENKRGSLALHYRQRPELEELCLRTMQAAVDVMTEQFADAMRGPGAFGPELTPPEGADTQTRLLAFLGRQAW